MSSGFGKNHCESTGQFILSISIADLLAYLLGEGEFNILASKGSKSGHTLLKGLRNIDVMFAI